MKVAPAIKRQTVTSSVLDLLRDRIISGFYEGGHQIRQEAIADEVGVSRIPVREALVQLEAEGLVVIHTHKGAVVAKLTADDAIDIFEARLMLEPFILQKSMDQARDEDVARVWNAFHDYEKALVGDQGPAALSQLNWAFHTALSLPANRPRSLSVLSSLYNSADRYLRLQIDAKAAQTKALAEHKELAEYFAEAKHSAAQKLLKKHITDARDDVIRGLEHRKLGAA
ncbi:GntR family transcriptional regulator [Brucella sp. NBRC 113783]|uniref:GntR family transcriptional regulator n=1 Tax=Brucella sp. NBRC 113783 TaxID=3075478 RepID=UPI0029C0FC9A|nr:GntR family transcriptional regulator [Brucella sp. NBRC 113783]MDX4075579.1 GntR family transcriptional regulator [Brucella sp. NBRC 113783]